MASKSASSSSSSSRKTNLVVGGRSEDVGTNKFSNRGGGGGGNSGGGGYEIPSSIVSLPTRLQRKIQKETECQLNNAENCSKILNNVKIKEKFNEVEQEPKGKINSSIVRHENYSQIMGQSPQRIRQDGSTDIKGNELEEKGTDTDGLPMGFFLSPTVLVKERTQHSLKDSCSNSFLPRVINGKQNSGIGTIITTKTTSTTTTTINSEPPSWFKNTEIIDKNDYWRKKMHNLTNLHSKLFEFLDNDEMILSNWIKIMEYRKLMMEIFKKILEYNLKFCCKENIEMYFWKILNYNLIERLRKNIQQLQQQQQQQKNQQQNIISNTGGVGNNGIICNNIGNNYTISIMLQDLKLKSFQLIDDGIQFYELQYQFLKNKYFKQQKKLNKIEINKQQKKYEILAKILMQKFLIHLGDLSRYKEQINNGQNFLISKKYYKNAQKLIPSNGIPYNQLAIISIYYKKTFDAIYYYMRSLNATNPIYSAKESLKELFDEIRKKYEENNLRSKIPSSSSSTITTTKSIQLQNDDELNNLPLKKEIWINPNGIRHLHRFGSINTKQLLCINNHKLIQLKSDDLNKNFITNYLCLLGKLFTGIGFENLSIISHQMLFEFKILLFNSSTIKIFPKNRLLQIIALNIFVIEYNRQQQQKQNQQQKEICCNHAFNISSLIFGIILNRCNEILRELLSSSDNNSSDDDESTITTQQSSTITTTTTTTLASVTTKTPSTSMNVLKLSSSSPTSSSSSSSDLLKTIKNKKSNNLTKNKYGKKELNYNQINDELKILLQSIKIWCNWLKINLSYWNPLKKFIKIDNYYNFINDYDEINPWNGLSQLITLLSCIELRLNNDKQLQQKCVKLTEDIYLNGFLPLNSNKINIVDDHDNDNDDDDNDDNNDGAENDDDDVDNEINSDMILNEKIEMIQRIEFIKNFGMKILCECEPPVFEKVLDATGAIVYIKNIIKENDNGINDALESFENFNDDDPDLLEDDISVTTTTTTLPSTTTTNSTINKISSKSSSLPSSTNNVVVIDNSNDKSSNNDILELIKRKQELEFKTKQQQIYKKKLEYFLENSITIYHIEVRPKYLIPDTNCFIDFLNLLKKIIDINLKRYILAIPIVVCNELEGLSKGFKISNIKTLQTTSSTIRHFDDVTIRARESLEFIKNKKHSCIKYITTKGSILNTSNFIVEDDYDDDENDDKNYDDDGICGSIELNGISTISTNNRNRNIKNSTNDDRILQTAVNLCKRTNNEKKMKDKIFIQTECVLLTTDRNLRVKALSRNLSVSQLTEFISWASIYEK